MWDRPAPFVVVTRINASWQGRGSRDRRDSAPMASWAHWPGHVTTRCLPLKSQQIRTPSAATARRRQQGGYVQRAFIAKKRPSMIFQEQYASA